MKTISATQLPDILIQMSQYLKDNCSKESYRSYFNDIVESGLFFDNFGKTIDKTATQVTVVTDY